MNSPRPILLLVLAVSLAVPSLQAAHKTWTNPAGGGWNTPGNWSPVGIPLAGDSVFITNAFAKDSAILTGGGMKGVALPADFMRIITEFLGVDKIQEGYGFSESSTFHWACEEGRYHVMPWVVPLLRAIQLVPPFCVLKMPLKVAA